MKPVRRASALALVMLIASSSFSAAAEITSWTVIGDNKVVGNNTVNGNSTINANNAVIADNDVSIDGLPGIIVVGSTPLVGSEVNRDQVPASTRILEPGDINRTGIPSLTGAILDNVPSASVNDTEGNLFQPDLLFRGFTASPVAGTAQGLAVYVNGARFNDGFGDTVNWDLIPPTAIDSVNLEAANPIFGLNALGGSVNIRLKSGFTRQTQSVTAYGGSYGRESGILEFGRQIGQFAVYAAADATHDDGFRRTGTSNLYRLFTDFGWRAPAGEFHLSINAAHDVLGNPGATPEQALNANIANIFTAPNVVDNTYSGFNLNVNVPLRDPASVQGTAYFQTLNQVIPNGITAQVAPCGDGTGLLCNDDGSVVTTRNGRPLADFLNGAAYSGLSVQQLNTHAYGISLQLTDRSAVASHANDFVAGASFDGSRSLFAGVQELGGFNPYTRDFVDPGVVLDQPGEGVNPVRVRSETHFYGVFVTDLLTLAPKLDATLAGRFNDARIDLSDELGGPVHGTHTYRRFNPSAGLTYRFTPELQAYGNYAQTTRAPTPQELSCASAAAPCSLLNFFVGDPNLRQVVARSVEIGLRGGIGKPDESRVSWSVDAYRTENTDDIIYETTIDNPNLAFYTNAGRTLRRGVEADVRYDAKRLHLKLGYALTDATFQTPLLLNSGDNPAADANGQEQVRPGNRLPGIPRHRVNIVLDYAATGRLTVGASARLQSSFYRFGDEANLTAPLRGYTVVDLNAAFRFADRVTLFAVVNNAFDRRYFTYGSFGPVGDVPWPNVPGGVSDTRTASPGAPISVYGGARFLF